MNLNEVKSKIDALEYRKSRLLFFTGEKAKFTKLMEQLQGCQLVSVRQMLLHACRERGIKRLDRKTTTQLLKELLPQEKEQPVALTDNELLLKHHLFATAMRSQAFQDITYLIHIPNRYTHLMKNEEMNHIG